VRQLHLDLDHTPESVRPARRAAAEFVRALFPRLRDLEAFVDDVMIVTSELVANAVVHGREPVSLDVVGFDWSGGHVVRVSCRDAGPWNGREPSPDRGRGLPMVRSLSSDLHIDADGLGTVVRATLER
jgi:anti-sigma regulatory factor (Ser/Thr protein kinase)